MLQKIIVNASKIGFDKDRPFKRNTFVVEQNILKYIRGFLDSLFCKKKEKNIALDLNAESRAPNCKKTIALNLYLLK